MEGFNKLPKMQCFKEGGAVKPAYKAGRHVESKEMEKDIAQDKAIVKKAFKMHDTQSHENEKTDLSKLRAGGRMKKEGGCVGRYKAGGAVEMKAGKKVSMPKTRKAKTPSAAMKATSNIKDMGASGALDSIMPPPASGGMAAAPSAPVDQMAPPPMMRKGGSLKKADAKANPGLAKLPTHVRNKMGYKKAGGKACD